MPNPNQVLPNTRYGAAFLDSKYKNFAALGEVIMDKITGEMYLKRKADGQIVSFVQNDKYLHDIILELNILMKNNQSFTYPNTTDSWFVSTDFNVTDMLDGEQDVIATPYIEFPQETLDETKRFTFKVSTETNGFFIRPIVRDTDKAVLAYLTNLYNSVFQFYTGANTDWTSEKAKFADTAYYRANATLSYSISITGLKTGDNQITRTYQYTKYIRTDEENFIEFPASIKSNLIEVKGIRVTINSIEYNKVSKVFEYMEQTPNLDSTVYDAFIAPDKAIKLRAINIFSFVDTAADIPANDKVVTTALVDTVHTNEFIGRVNKLSDGSGVIPAVDRPGDDIWTTNNAWCEIIRIVRSGGSVSETDHPTDIDALEEKIYKTTGTQVNFSLNSSDYDDIYIETVKED